MKTLNRVYIIAAFALVAVFVAVNCIAAAVLNSDGARGYRVEIARLAADIADGGEAEADGCEFVTAITADDGTPAFFEGGNSDCIIRRINGVYYRFDYINKNDRLTASVMLLSNLAMAAMAIVTVALLIYVRRSLIKPLYRLREVPYELSKGNLTVGIRENRGRFFGRFTWGLDLLREKLEAQKTHELELQKEKKTLILSISHDIKTPLSAIKLYSRALSANLYTDEEKRRQAAESINKNADEIERFISQIIRASNKDFLRLEVENGEFYLHSLAEKTREYYAEKTELLKVGFTVSDYDDCLLRGDLDRAVEVVQNIVENALKYGDGGYIRLDVASDDGCRLITVVNSGCTLSESELPHIFDSFWRGSNTGRNSGSGLGLYICRQLMLKMDGGIDAQINGNEMEVTAAFRMV